MAIEGTRKERFLFSNSLAGVVKGLEGQYTTIDLRNESCVAGKIVYVDAYMNIQLEDIVFYDQRGTRYSFEMFFINARLIRYVHIPKDRAAVQIVKDLIAKIRGGKKVEKVHTFKKQRAKRYQKEIVDEIAVKRQDEEES